jgi:hypothetical protein
MSVNILSSKSGVCLSSFSSVSLAVALQLDGTTAGLAPARHGVGAALGIPTVIADSKRRSESRQVVDSEGEIAFFDKAKNAPLFDREAEKTQRWLMLRQAQNILRHADDSFELRGKWEFVPYSVLPLVVGFVGPVQQLTCRTERLTVGPGGNIVQLEVLQPKFRTVLCLQRHVSGRDASVWQSRESGACSWHDVTVCGSPWTCPLCAVRINRGRQDQIKAVYNAIDLVGGAGYMLTFTVRHGIGDKCDELVTKMKAAQRLLQKTQQFKAATRKKPLLRVRADSLPYLGYLGRVAALEVTHGLNGWHPHEHHLWFFKRPLSRSAVIALQSTLFVAWADCCLAVGLPAPLAKFGLDVRIALSAAQYLAKFGDVGVTRRWGPEKEIASSHAKSGRAKGRSPMQILADSVGSVADAGRDFLMTRDCWLFLDFANSFLGRHQLQISRTLKAWLLAAGVDLDETEAGDLAIAHSLESDSVLQLELSASDFRCVVRNKSQFLVLQICQFAGSSAALDFVRSLPGWTDLSVNSDWRDEIIKSAPDSLFRVPLKDQVPLHQLPYFVLSRGF